MMCPATIFLGQRRRGGGLARAEEGSGEESARASAFFFEKIGGYKRRIHIWDYTSILRHGAIVDKVIIYIWLKFPKNWEKTSSAYGFAVKCRKATFVER
ncbi:MAG: hypothetical protein UY83_C0002G0108 [Candidatus Adlerbacteria bacterium GW2011_GWA1_54_10]|uniref:Uncharacterized protein n=3 Tax=Candidatus Adleribacteriota TaxID=1752736 RepID=A0A0G1WID9_9BACT|nr:MAG: hypothetical protein UY61_C0084G0003 [Candidatus Adlerbacteria bacterium GW2011_GWC1_50_9]KKW35951.1 MAG: hypothetical protein UY83_C0002G0108 [Candidatus Adlerbacteria bacterium GW2011_GWA1_54_10]KKW37909.1 MAG: hypothetical protein UY86_C0002G0006 [Candidatus Adlerbacteria bacterium GW2011_GWB1_54_7]